MVFIEPVKRSVFRRGGHRLRVPSLIVLAKRDKKVGDAAEKAKIKDNAGTIAKETPCS
jgi:hypothetical protein